MNKDVAVPAREWLSDNKMASGRVLYSRCGRKTDRICYRPIPPESIARSDNVDCQKRFAGYGEEKNWYTVDIIN